MKIRVSLVAVSLVAIAGLGLAASKPNFSGTWVLDKSRSFSNPAGLDQTLTIVHNGDQVKLDAKITTAAGEQSVTETYSLDGKETEFSPQPGPAGSPPAKGKRKASWMPDGKRILIADEVTRELPNGPVKDQTVRKWTLSPEGTTLTVDYFFDGPRGSFEAKRVFIKK
jgi:hypothetical protein